jgi:trk system potassium uptake protein
VPLSKKNILELKPAQFIISSILAVSLLGAVLLMLPISNSNAYFLNPLSAIFMSISATCVTGLVVMDISQDLSFFGQLVILILIQVGGLGYMSLTSILVYLIGKRLSISDTKVFNLANNTDPQINLKNFVINIGIFTIIFEIFGAISLAKDSIAVEKIIYGDNLQAVFSGIFHAVFHSISAFCNAGLSLYSTSLEAHSNNYWFLFVFSFLTILGGLGYTTLHEIYEYFKRNGNFGLSLHAKICIKTTIALLIIGTFTQLLLIYALDLPKFVEHGINITNKITELYHNTWISFFQTCAARTSGFNVVPISELGEPSLILLIFWMFIGACPGSTAGGIKVTTLILIFMVIYSSLRNHQNIKLTNRSINKFSGNKAIIVFTSAIFIIVFCSFLLSIFEHHQNFSFLEILFEVCSAFNTVGLSTGITSQLSDPSLLVLCLCMLIGRPGPLLFLMALIPEGTGKELRYPEEGILIG